MAANKKSASALSMYTRKYADVTVGDRKKTGKQAQPEEKRTVSEAHAASARAAEAAYDARRERLRREREESRRAAAVNETLLRRYLPVQREASGLDGLGISQSAATEAKNSYLRTLGEIERGYLGDLAALEEAEAKEQKALTERYSAQLEKDQDEYYERLLEDIYEQRFYSTSDLEGMMKKAKEVLRPAQYTHVESVVEGYYRQLPSHSSK